MAEIGSSGPDYTAVGKPSTVQIYLYTVTWDFTASSCLDQPQTHEIFNTYSNSATYCTVIQPILLQIPVELLHSKQHIVCAVSAEHSYYVSGMSIPCPWNIHALSADRCMIDTAYPHSNLSILQNVLLVHDMENLNFSEEFRGCAD